MIAFVTTDWERYRLAREFDVVAEFLHPIPVKEVFCPEQLTDEDILLIRSKDRRVIDLFASVKNRIVEQHETISLDNDKQKLKDLLALHGICTPRTVRVSEIKEGKRYFVKPLALGDSIGINRDSLCTTREEVLLKLQNIRDTLNERRTLIEEYIDGDEYTVSVANVKGETLSAVTKVESYTGFLSFDVKSKDLEKVYAEEDDRLKKRLENIAIKVCKIIGVKHYARVDVRMQKNTPVVLEVNVVPGLSKRGYLCTSLCQKYGFGYDELLKKLFWINE